LSVKVEDSTDSDAESENDNNVGFMSENSDETEKAESEEEEPANFAKRLGDGKLFFADKGDVLSWEWIKDRFEKAALIGGSNGYDCKLLDSGFH